jgi:hypothetical protein
MYALIFIKEFNLLISGTKNGELIAMDTNAMNKEKRIIKVIDDQSVQNVTYLSDRKILLVTCKLFRGFYFSATRLQKLRKVKCPLHIQYGTI